MKGTKASQSKIKVVIFLYYSKIMLVVTWANRVIKRSLECFSIAYKERNTTESYEYDIVDDLKKILH